MADTNREWLERNFPCKQTCPVHTEAGKYVAGAYIVLFALVLFVWGAWMLRQG